MMQLIDENVFSSYVSYKFCYNAAEAALWIAVCSVYKFNYSRLILSITFLLKGLQ